MPAYPGERAANLEAQDDVTRRASADGLKTLYSATFSTRRRLWGAGARLDREVGGAGLEPATLGM